MNKAKTLLTLLRRVERYKMWKEKDLAAPLAAEVKLIDDALSELGLAEEDREYVLKVITEE